MQEKRLYYGTSLEALASQVAHPVNTGAAGAK